MKKQDFSGLSKFSDKASGDVLTPEKFQAMVSDQKGPYMKKDLRKQPRWLQMIKAHLGGYFWLPCPICGEKFGGHEWGGNLYRGNGSGEGTCANCAVEAAKRSTKIYEKEGI